MSEDQRRCYDCVSPSGNNFRCQKCRERVNKYRRERYNPTGKRVGRPRKEEKDAVL